MRGILVGQRVKLNNSDKVYLFAGRHPDGEHFYVLIPEDVPMRGPRTMMVKNSRMDTSYVAP